MTNRPIGRERIRRVRKTRPAAALTDETLPFDVGDVALDEVQERLKKQSDSVGKLWNRHLGVEKDLERILTLLESQLPGGRLHWETLSGSAKAERLESIAAFIEFLHRTYLSAVSEYRIKPCWWQHPDLLWQVTAIYAAFIETYNATEPPSTKHASFHEHVLWPILERIRHQRSQHDCSWDEHKGVPLSQMKRDPKLIERMQELREEDNDASSPESLSSDAAGDVVGGMLLLDLPTNDTDDDAGPIEHGGGDHRDYDRDDVDESAPE